MEELTAIKRKVWNGSVNVQIRYHIESNNDNQETSDLEYVLRINRMSYFPVYFKSIVSYFNHFTNIGNDVPIWLAYKGEALKWNVPVGVLYDYHHLKERLSLSKSSDSIDLNSSVWQLELNVGNYPSSQIIPFVTRDQNLKINPNGGFIDYEKSLQENFFNQLKQSNFVINGNCKMVMNLSKDDSTGFWDSIITHNLSDYESLNKKVLPTRVSKIPIKIYRLNSSLIQLPVNNSDMTLGEVLDLETIEKAQCKDCYIHGISCDSLQAVKLLEIWKLFKHLDNFLYITIISM